MARHLAAHVHVYDDQGVAHVFGPDAEVPAWAAAKITNPSAWDSEELVIEDETSDPDDRPTEEWTVPDIRAWAELAEIDLGDATKKADILKVINGQPAV